jgi:hypothetical protein
VNRSGLVAAAYPLALVLAVGYAAAGLVGWITDVTDGDGSDLAFWLLFLFGGAALLLAGLFLVPRWSNASVALVSVGALAGAIAVFWSVIVPLLAIVLIVLAVMANRGARARPA